MLASQNPCNSTEALGCCTNRRNFKFCMTDNCEVNSHDERMGSGSASSQSTFALHRDCRGCLISGLCLMMEWPTIVHSCGMKSWMGLHSIIGRLPMTCSQVAGFIRKHPTHLLITLATNLRPPIGQYLCRNVASSACDPQCKYSS